MGTVGERTVRVQIKMLSAVGSSALFAVKVDDWDWREPMRLEVGQVAQVLARVKDEPEPPRRERPTGPGRRVRKP